MKQKKVVLSAVFLLIGIGSLQAQESLAASGGEATGAGGTSSFTVGQVFYTTQTGTGGNVAQGVQQPYEVMVTTGVNETSINLEVNVYPNPTTNYLSLTVENNNDLSFQLIDLQGKLIENKELRAKTTTINMETLPKAVYFLNVISTEGQIVKTFKVIKN